jgi:hypothetical protein
MEGRAMRTGPWPVVTAEIHAKNTLKVPSSMSVTTIDRNTRARLTDGGMSSTYRHQCRGGYVAGCKGGARVTEDEKAGDWHRPSRAMPTI